MVTSFLGLDEYDVVEVDTDVILWGFIYRGPHFVLSRIFIPNDGQVGVLIRVGYGCFLFQLDLFLQRLMSTQDRVLVFSGVQANIQKRAICELSF